MAKEVQKGKIQANVKTMKTTSPRECHMEDAREAALKRSAMEMTFHTPKK